MALVFSLPLQREVMIMTDCEMLVNFIMVITMAFSIQSIAYKKYIKLRPPSSANCVAPPTNREGISQQQAPSIPVAIIA